MQRTFSSSTCEVFWFLSKNWVFSRKLELPNSGCSLCASVAYPPVFTVLLEVFSNITHKIQPSVYLFLLEWTGFLTYLSFFQLFIFFFLLILRRFTWIAFPCFSMTHTSISGLPSKVSMTFKVFHGPYEAWLVILLKGHYSIFILILLV